MMQACNTLLLVDDMQINRIILRAMFEDEYDILEAENGEQAVALLNKNKERIAAVLLDLLMPVMDGYEVLKEMGADRVLSRIPAVVITADNTTESEIRSFDLGASDIITKPFESHAVKRRVKNAAELYKHKLHLEDLLEEQAARIRESNTALIDGLTSVIEHRSMESGQHIRRIRGFTKILLEEVAREHREYGLDENVIQIIASASSLHDIGKIAIPDAILNKPGRLTSSEFNVMKTHSVRGCEILASLDRMREPEYLRYAYNICRYHHERWDGKGYPDGLKENSIPLCAQVVALADCFDALTTDRVYKKAIPQSEAYNMILHGECGEFAPALLECFKNVQSSFFRLSQKYADGMRPTDESDFYVETALPSTFRESPAMLGQMKLSALLHYLDATVLEVDRNAGTYHLLYQADHNFWAFQQEKTIKDAGMLFVKERVHPVDQALVLERFNTGYHQFFSEGLFSISSRYRILDQDSDKYLWYQVSVLRLGVDDPRQCRALVIWRRETSASKTTHDADSSQEQCCSCSKVPVATVRRKNDRFLTMTEMNSQFLHLVGYSKEELKTRFKNQMSALIEPVDWERVTTQLQSQIDTGCQSQIEYRLQASNGETLWVLESDLLVREENGEEYFQCVLTNISSSKQVQEELRQSLERYRIAVQQEGDVVFEWNIPQDRFWASGNWEMKFGFRPCDCLKKSLAGQDGHLYPLDLKNVQRAVNSVLNGALRVEAEFRLPTPNGQYHWQRARASVQLGSDGKPKRAIGVIVDIEEEKRAIQGLMNQAQRDSLTKLYHKGAAQERIKYYLEQIEENSICAMMLIDVDDFKSTNDQYGHLFGDTVLVEMSGLMEKMFQDGDVVARIGGDEFLVFMPFIASENVAIGRASQIVEACRTVMQKALNGLDISCSVGIALAPKHGKDYRTLFQNCDQALYQAKDFGKGTYAVYNPHKQWLQKSLDGEMKRNCTKVDSDTNFQLALSNMIAEVLQPTHFLQDFEKRISDVMARLGQFLYVSRVYVFEESSDGTYCTNTLEWCKERISPHRNIQKNIQYADYESDYRHNFNEQGIFYCHNINNLSPDQRKLIKSRGILTTLQCAVLDNEKFLGFIGFDDCEINRYWTQSQIDAIGFVSKILFMCLWKARKENQVSQALSQDEVDCQNANQNEIIKG